MRTFFARSNIVLPSSMSPVCRITASTSASLIVEAAHRLGVEVHVWTVNEVEEMRQMLALGVDGIITDLPERLLAILSEGLRP